MNKVILTILVFCFAVFSVSAQVENKTTTTASQKNAVKAKTASQKNKVEAKQSNLEIENPNAPVITFDKLVHDYGIMAQNADGNSEFKFTNEGKEPLILTNVRAS